MIDPEDMTREALVAEVHHLRGKVQGDRRPVVRTGSRRGPIRRRVLASLERHPGCCVSYEQLLADMYFDRDLDDWPEWAEAALRVQVSFLRAAGAQISAVRGCGYRLDSGVSQ